MAKKPKESETIRQRKYAQKEFLELKKMQNGEIEIKNDAEEKIVPKTFGDKIKNFWYHDKVFIIIALFLSIVIVTVTVQCCNRTNYDLKVIYFTYTTVPDELTDKLAGYFEENCDDVNKDGEVHVSVVNCSCDPNGSNNAKITKLQALIASDSQALVFITDEESIGFFDNLRKDGTDFFEKEQIDFTQKFEEITEYASEQKLVVTIRRIGNTTIATDKDIKTNYKAAKKLLGKIKNNK